MTTLLMMIVLLFSINSYSAEFYETPLLISNMIKAAEIKYEIPTGLLTAIAFVESKGDHTAFVKKDGKSNQSSYGLLQIQLASARMVKFKGKAQDLMLPEVNIEYGAAYLHRLLMTHENNVSWSLTCWNAGPNSSACKSKKYGSYVGSIMNVYMKQNSRRSYE